jgi:hypothetical protein
MPTQKLNPEIGNAAIQGFEAQKRRIDEQIVQLRALLHGTSTEPATTPEAPNRKRRMSAAGRRAIAEATRKRWAAFRATKRAAGTSTNAGLKQTARKKGAAKKAKGKKASGKTAKSSAR